MQVTPAILPHSFEELSEKMERVAKVALRVQIDLCDGKMGKELTWMPQGNEVLPYVDTIEYECDIMVYDWKPLLPKVLALKMRRIVMHIDSFTESDCKELAELCKDFQIPLGLAVNNDVDLAHFDELVGTIHTYYPKIFIQVMGIRDIGEQGQPFDETCIPRILHSKQVFRGVPVQVDGAMRPETASKIRETGVETIVTGSYLFMHDDIGQLYSELASID